MRARLARLEPRHRDADRPRVEDGSGGGREIDLTLGLQEELTEWRTRSPRTRPSDPVFVTGRPRNGQHVRQTPRNVQARLTTVVKAANKRLKAEGIDGIGKVSPHSLRRTYASLRAALRDDPIYIAEQMGHKDARFTFSVYQKAANRRGKLKHQAENGDKLAARYLEAFDAARDWAAMGTRGDSGDVLYAPNDPVQAQETAKES